MTSSILVVDDSLTVRMDLLEALQEAGFRAIPCETGAQARELLAREAIDLVILDLVLPDVDGIELLREIRGDTAHNGLPVMLLSSEAEVGSRIRGLLTGADEFVGKPYDRGYLVARARELLRGKTEAGATGEITILVIDDSPTFREAIGRVLEEALWQVVYAASGEEGLRLAADRRPNAIVVDGSLPGIDGSTVIRRIRLDSALRRTPCLLLTASEEESAEVQALEAGADAFVRKDEDTTVVVARLRAVLRNAGGPAPEPPTSSLLSPKKILAVDDSETYLQSVADILREEGYDPILARSGEEALDLLAIQAVDCILMDLVMPGLGGRESCRRIKSAPGIRDIPLILLTAVEDREVMIQGLGDGADDYVAKSSEWQVLRARVRAQIRRRQFEDENRKIRQRLARIEIQATEARAARELAEVRATLLQDLEHKNKELEAFSYSVSHDLRAPVRAIEGFSKALLESQQSLDVAGKDHLGRIRNAASRMNALIDDLLELSRIGMGALQKAPVDLSQIARTVAVELERNGNRTNTQFAISEGLQAHCDPRLLRVVFENLLGNAWKFTAKASEVLIEVGVSSAGEPATYFVRDNGAGFDAKQARALFAPFQRFHAEADFPGTGIGLATVYRIIDRHGGRIWAESAPGKGAAFFWTLAAARKGREDNPAMPEREQGAGVGERIVNERKP